MKTFLAIAAAAIILLGLVVLAPRTAFADRTGDGCFDGVAAVAKLKADGYEIRGAGFTGSGKSMIEIWALPNGGRFIMVVFNGQTGKICIVTAGLGWQTYAGTQGGGM